MNLHNNQTELLFLNWIFDDQKEMMKIFDIFR